MDKFKWFVSIIVVGIVLNIFLLYYFLFSLRGEIQGELDGIKNQTVQPQVTLDQNSLDENLPSLSTESSSCSLSCLEAIDKVKEMIAKVTPQVVKEIEKTTLPQTAPPSVSEYFVFIGSGSVRTQDWSNVSGLTVEIDSSKYKRIASARFEASLRIPTGVGRVYARLYNSTDKHPVWFSEITTDSSASQFLQSEGITLDAGNKTYVVQMKSTIGAEALIDSARVKITVK